MKTIAVSVAVVATLLGIASAQLCPDDANRYVRSFDVDKIMIQTFQYVYVLTDNNLTMPTVVVDSTFSYPSFDDVISAQVSDDGLLILQPMGSQNESCVFLSLPGFASMELTVNDASTAWFVGERVTLNNATLNVISGDFVAGNATEVVATTLTYNATGRGTGVFESVSSRAEHLLVNISGNSNLTWAGQVMMTDVVVGGQGVVEVAIIESLADVTLVGRGNLTTMGSAGLTITGLSDAPNIVNYMLGSCSVVPGEGQSPTFMPCKQVGSLEAVSVLG